MKQSGLAALFSLALASLALAQGAPPVLPGKALLSGGCCPSATWTPDSQALLFLDGPPARASTGVYQVPASGGNVTRRFSSIFYASPNLQWAVRPGGLQTVLERLADGRRFTLPTNGADVTWSPSETRLAYTRSVSSGNYDRRESRVYVANVFGTPRQIATLYGGGVSAWLDERRVLLSGKTEPEARNRQLWTQDIISGKTVSLGSALSFRGLSASPDGQWVVYYVAFDRQAENGLFVQNTVSGARRKLSEFGSYRWRDAGHLLLIPLAAGGTHLLREYDLNAATWRTLGSLGDQVRQGDWSISPDGEKLSYLSARDGNLRVIALPE